MARPLDSDDEEGTLEKPPFIRDDSRKMSATSVVQETDFAFDHIPTNQPSDAFPSPSLPSRRISVSHHLQATETPSRALLRLKAVFWRRMMALGMVFHFSHYEKAPYHDFSRTILTDTKPIKLYFYLPKTYRACLESNQNHKFPVVVNFHGGGFCIGHPTDDAYWARIILRHTPAIYVSVGYRMAPEHPFPTPVDDSVEALLYIAAHASELHIDPGNVALSGFSAGANLAFTAPFKLRYQRKLKAAHTNQSAESLYTTPMSPTIPVTSIPPHLRTAQLTSGSSTSLLPTTISTTSTASTTLTKPPLTRNPTILEESPLNIRSIIAWYPLLDWTASRDRKRRESRNPQKCLSKLFTDLFDFSYLPPPDLRGDHYSPYASPSLAPGHMIINGLPKHIQLWLCEWDMLLAEGLKFSDRLTKMKKDVCTEILPKKAHGFDKSANPFRDQKSIDRLYVRAADKLNQVFKTYASPESAATGARTSVQSI